MIMNILCQKNIEKTPDDDQICFDLSPKLEYIDRSLLFISQKKEEIPTEYSVVIERMKKDVALISSFPENDWKLVNNRASVKVFTKAIRGEKIHMAKIETLIPACIDYVFQVLNEMDIKKRKWDKMLEKSQVLEVLNDQSSIVYMAYKTPPLIKKRDVCYLSTWSSDAATSSTDCEDLQKRSYTVLSTSVDHSGCPSSIPGFVRACIRVMYTTIREIRISPPLVSVVNVSHFDPGGHLPPVAINKTLKMGGDGMAEMRKQLMADYSRMSIS